jgi:hypothetical protein
MALCFSTVMNNIFYNVSDIRGRDIRLINVPRAAQAAVQPYLNASAEDLAAIQEMESQAAVAAVACLNASAEDLAAIQEMEARAAAAEAVAAAKDLAAIQEMEARAAAAEAVAAAKDLAAIQEMEAIRQLPPSRPAFAVVFDDLEQKYSPEPICRPEPARVSAESEERIRQLRVELLQPPALLGARDVSDEDLAAIQEIEARAAAAAAKDLAAIQEIEARAAAAAAKDLAAIKKASRSVWFLEDHFDSDDD